METIDIVNKNKKLLAKVKIFLWDFKNLSRNEIMAKILNDLEGENIGFKNKEEAKEFLNWSAFGRETEDKFTFKYEQEIIKEIRRNCEQTFSLCSKFIKEPLHVYMFPIFDKFVINAMGGCLGFCNAPNIIALLLNFKENWQQKLREVLCHEIAHAISPFYKEGNYTLAEGFILDGLAEHFREAIIGGEKAPWSNAITRENSRKILLSVKDKFQIKDLGLWQEIFFGSSEYPKWTGYSIGYYLFRDYLKKLNREKKKINWEDIINTPPRSIFDTIITDWLPKTKN